MRFAPSGADPVSGGYKSSNSQETLLAGHCQFSALNDRRVGVRKQKDVTTPSISTPPVLELIQQSFWNIVRWM
jgi:hypothetical protein